MTLKNYGCRTLIGNWWEERIVEQTRHPDIQIRDMTVDLHQPADEETPKMLFNAPQDFSTSYKIDNDPSRISEQARLQRRLTTAENRHRLQGTKTIDRANTPGGTQTPSFLTKQFIDPHKQRLKTVYQKSYCRPELIASMTKPTFDEQQPNQQTIRRHSITESSWKPGWK